MADLKNLDHMFVPWRTEQVKDGSWEVLTDEADPWGICTVDQFLPGDRSGELTARAICAEHNAGLAGTASEKEA